MTRRLNGYSLYGPFLSAADLQRWARPTGKEMMGDVLGLGQNERPFL